MGIGGEVLILATVSFHGTRPECCRKCHPVPTGQKGFSIEFLFDEEWDELPFRKAVFWAGDTVIDAGYITDSVEIPSEICKRPYVPLLVGVVGCDADPDAATIARAEEITARMNAIDEEILSADSDTVAELFDEHVALVYEMKSLGLVTKRLPSIWCKIGWILPGAVSPNAP